MLRIVADRRRSLGEDHTRMISQLHPLLRELIPGGATPTSPRRRQRCWAGSAAGRGGKARNRVAPDLITDLGRRPAQKSVTARMTAAVREHGSRLSECRRDLALGHRGPAARGRRRPQPVPTEAISRPRTAPPRWKPPPAIGRGTGCPGPGTGRSIGRCTPWPSSSYDAPAQGVPITAEKWPRQKAKEAMRSLKRRLADLV